MRFLNRHSDTLYSLMRLIAGFLYGCHGAQKLFGVLGSPPMRHIPLMLAAGIIEFFGGLLIAVGVFTSLAALSPAVKWPLPISCGTLRLGSGPFAITASLRFYSALFFFTSPRAVTAKGALAGS